MLARSFCYFFHFFLIFFLFGVLFINRVGGVTYPAEVKFGAIAPLLTNTSEASVAFRVALEQINNSTTLLPHTKLTMLPKHSSLHSPTALKGVLELEQEGIEIIFCCYGSGETSYTVPATTIFQMIQLSYFTNADYLTANKEEYPYFARITPKYTYQVDAFFSLLQYLANQSGQKQYLDLGIIIHTRPNGIFAAKEMIAKAPTYNARILAYQQFISSLDTGLVANVTIEVRQLKNSGARVFVAVLAPADMQIVANTSAEVGIIGDHYIWICFDGCSLPATVGFSVDTLSFDDYYYDLMLGMIGLNQVSSVMGAEYNQLVEKLEEMGEGAYPFNLYPPTIGIQYLYDALFFIASVIHNVIEADGFTEEGLIKDKKEFYRILTGSEYEGVTGLISLSPDGDRLPAYDYLNLKPNSNTFDQIGKWTLENGSVIDDVIVYPGNTTVIPDLDIRPPFAYWDCEKGDREVDLSGKSINVKRPGGSNPRYIDIDYHCDQFIDCSNLSDESSNGCSSNYLILFIVFGVLTAFLILIAILFFILTLLFGYLLPRKRFISASPLFLLLLVISCIVGYSSIFAWFGKPHHVACAFQPWLLGLSINSMIAALSAKTFRIWRIFKSPFNRKVITDFELLLLWVILMLPAVLILALWTLISTPTATLVKRDGDYHYVCETGGFTGPPGGYIFFAIFVAYSALLLCFGAFLSIVTRNVPALFNESKLISVSIYHLIFLSIVTIPVIIVLNTLNPFVGWIIRTSAIIYAFTATLFIQFLPKIVNLILIDHCRNNLKVDSTKGLADLDKTATDAFSQIPEARSHDSSN